MDCEVTEWFGRQRAKRQPPTEIPEPGDRSLPDPRGGSRMIPKSALVHAAVLAKVLSQTDFVHLRDVEEVQQ